jgi:arginine decarboxylase
MEEFNTEHFDVNSDGELVVREGNFQYNILKIVKKYGTPTEIVFPTLIENRVRDLIETFSAYNKILGYKGKFYYHYAMKVNQNREFVLPAVAEGANLEVSSANELFLVKRMIEQEKFNIKIRVICNGPKTDRYMSLIEELRGKGLVVIPIIEDYVELERMRKFNGPVGVRVNLNIRVPSHWDKKYNRYGFTEEELNKIGKINNLSILHYHISSQVDRIEGLVGPMKRALTLFAVLKEKNLGLDTLDIGGGAGVPYEKKKRYYTAKGAISQIIRAAKKHSEKLGIKHPNLIVEWGRYVAAPTQITIFKVLSEKLVENKNDKYWYSIDGSFINDLSDTWAIHQKWHIVPVNNLNKIKLRKTWLAGSSCDSDDRYNAGDCVPLPRLDECGELYIAVFDTGAYQDSLASHHCLLSSPMKLVAANGEIKVSRRRETPEEVGKMFGW